jgi:hypothetical protein
LARY